MRKLRHAIDGMFNRHPTFDGAPSYSMAPVARALADSPAGRTARLQFLPLHFRVNPPATTEPGGEDEPLQQRPEDTQPSTFACKPPIRNLCSLN